MWMRKRYSEGRAPGLGSYLAGTVVARAGDEMSGPALLLAGFAVAGSTTAASSLLAGITIAAAVGGPVLGALLDRAARPGPLLAGALALYATGLVVVLAALGRLPIAVTVLIAVVTGLLGPVLSGGWTAQLPRVAPGEKLARANALDAMTFSTAALVGPALAGGTAELIGAPAAVVASSVLIGLAVPAAWRLPAGSGTVRAARTDSAVTDTQVTNSRATYTQTTGPRALSPSAPKPTQRHPTTAPGPHRPAIVRDLAAGARCIVATPHLARATLTSVVCCVAQGMMAACLPLLGERILGGAGHGALLLSCAAVASLAANAVLARFPHSFAPDTVIRSGALLQAVALALAATGGPVTLIAAVLLIGVAEGPQLTALFAVRHREAPEHLRGQIFTTGASLKITGFALGAAVAGPLVTWSLPGTLMAAAGVAALAALAHLA
jgi:MFS family permease